MPKGQAKNPEKDKRRYNTGRTVGTTKPDDKKADRVNISLKPGQRDKLKKLGGSKWIQEQIDKV